ncbi:MAG: hypothetical protein J0M04_03520 [Verrucomicrobia bacterium]|nr:hypothetical protein [Verrucomicrobiota bacterium]
MNPQPEPAPDTSPRQLLRRAARALKLGRSLTAMACGLVVAGVALAIWLTLDARLRFGATGRWLGFAAFALPLLAAIVTALRGTLRRIDAAAIARRLETTTGRDDNALVNAVQLDEQLGDNPQWRNIVLGELAGRWNGAQWQRIYNWKKLRRWGAAAGALALAGGLFWLVKPGEFSQRMARVLLPAREIAPLTETRVLDVSPGNRTVARGTTLPMSVTLAGKAPAEVWLVVAANGGNLQRIVAIRDGETMRWSAGHRWNESGGYWFEAGDARSFSRNIEVTLPAKVVSSKLTILPPAYTKLPVTTVPHGAPWPSVPQGSGVVVDWTFDRGVTSLTIDRNDATATAGSAPEQWRLTGKLALNRSWTARWTDTTGLTDQSRITFNLKPDEAPRVRLIQPTGEEEILLTRDSTLRLTFEATDDYGLADVALCRGTQEKPDGRVMQSWQPGARSFKQTADIQLARWIGKEESEAWFCIAARDGNDVTGPGRTLSRMLVVKIVTPEELRRATESKTGSLLGNLDDLIRLQQTNLEATRAAMKSSATDDSAPSALAERQTRVQESATQLVAGTPPGSAAWRDLLEQLVANEIPRAVLALRDAVAAKDAPRRTALAKAEALEITILARLKNLPADLRDEASGTAARDLIGRVEALFKRQQETHARIGKAAKGEGPAIAADQDALADESQSVSQALADGSSNASIGDAAFRTALTKAAEMMGTARIYEQMILCAEHLEAERFGDAAVLAKQVLVDLAKILELLNNAQRGAAGDKAESLKEAAEQLKEKLDALVEQQRAVVEKSRELASKDQLSPEDEAIAKELAEKKEELAKLIEQMLTDAHAFPDLRPMNELREELTKIYEDVIQQDAEQAAAGELKPSEIAVQKEESLLEALEKAAETAEDMEMWLPDKNETTKWLMENFDLTEMPEIPNLPLPDSFTDLVGDLLKEQEGLAEEVQDAASNNAFAVNPANGWEVADGPMPGFNAQGKSGNTPPNKNEQTGRSSGGREGMSSGEMVNQRADKLEGSSIDARRTNDPLQKGQVQDDGPPADAKATGGGKAGGASQREGMTGEAPLRPVNSPNRTVNDALAAEQALLAQQTAKSYATARLFYLRAGPLPEVARLMDESREALKSGRLADYEALHRRIIANLRQLGEGGSTGTVKTLEGPGSRFVGEKRLPGGADVAVPPGFQQPVDDYYRSLDAP